MTKQEYKNYQEAARKGSISDEQNPALSLDGVSNELLGKVVKGELDLNALAALTLASRGYDENGNWVGFKK